MKKIKQQGERMDAVILKIVKDGRNPSQQVACSRALVKTISDSLLDMITAINSLIDEVENLKKQIK